MFTWRFKSKDYWEAVPVSGQIRSVEQLMALHEPWVTSNTHQVLQIIRAPGGHTSLDNEGLITVEVGREKLEEINVDLAKHGCTLSNELLHTV